MVDWRGRGGVEVRFLEDCGLCASWCESSAACKGRVASVEMNCDNSFLGHFARGLNLLETRHGWDEGGSVRDTWCCEQQARL